MNRVTNLANITASVIGADVDGDGTRAFSDNATGPNPNNGFFQLGDGDTLRDGAVLAVNIDDTVKTLSFPAVTS